MAIILRRIFYGKVGSAGPLVQHMKEADVMLSKYGPGFKSRTMTDWMSGLLTAWWWSGRWKIRPTWTLR